MHLFLDDERRPGQVTWVRLPDIMPCQWHIVRDIDAFRSFIDENLPNIQFISFDHDLGPNHYPWNGNDHSDGRTGMDCAKYLVEKCMDLGIRLPDFSVHSMNPVGKANIESLLNGFRRHQST